MLFKFLIYSFAVIPMQNLRMNADIDFNENLNNILMSVGTVGYFLPKLFRNNEKCYNDEDCPLIMKCCEIGLTRFCCTPNNYIQLKPAFVKETVKESIEKNNQ